MMNTNSTIVKTIELANEAASSKIALLLANNIHPNIVMTFCGEIGTGKTTIIRALLQALGVKSTIKSPTFSLVESYECKGISLHHFDLYRIHHEEELEYIGFRDYFTKNSICCIEWPEHAGHLLPNEDIRFTLNIKGAGREMQVNAFSVTGKKILACLAG